MYLFYCIKLKDKTLKIKSKQTEPKITYILQVLLTNRALMSKFSPYIKIYLTLVVGPIIENFARKFYGQIKLNFEASSAHGTLIRFCISIFRYNKYQYPLSSCSIFPFRYSDLAIYPNGTLKIVDTSFNK